MHIIFQNWVVEMLEEIISKQTDLSLGAVTARGQLLEKRYKHACEVLLVYWPI